LVGPLEERMNAIIGLYRQKPSMGKNQRKKSGFQWAKDNGLFVCPQHLRVEKERYYKNGNQLC